MGGSWRRAARTSTRRRRAWPRSATSTLGARIAGAVTPRSSYGAIVDNLRRRQVETIGLNVRTANAAAIRLYERLGFEFHARFWEGRAIRRRALS